MSNHGPQVELYDDAEDEWGNGAVQSTNSVLLEFRREASQSQRYRLIGGEGAIVAVWLGLAGQHLLEK